MEMKKRVLFIANLPSPYRVIFFNELSKYVDLTVAFELDYASNRNSAWKSDEEIRFTAIHMKSRVKTSEGAYCPEVFSLIRLFKEDIIVVGGYSSLTGMSSILYMKLHNIPFFLNADGGIVKPESWLKKRIKSFFISSATRWLSSGSHTNEYLMHYGATKENISIYPFTSIKEAEICSIPLDEKKRIKEELGIDSSRKTVLFVGSFIYRKGIDILLKACNRLTGINVVLVGDDDLDLYKDLISENLSSKIYAVGFKGENELKKYYEMADIFVLPTREDIWGLVINEAMSYGLPVITTNMCVAGKELIVSGNNGYLFDCEDDIALSQRIEQLVSNESLIAEMSKNALNSISSYTIEKMALRHAEIFSSC